MTKDQEKFIRNLLKGHTDFNDSKDFWEFLYDSYTGGHEYINGDYLTKHTRETKDNYEKRQKNAAYTNFCSPVIDLYTSYIFSGEIQRTIEVPSTYDAVVSQIEENFSNGLSQHEFMQQVARFTFVYGRMLVIVDAPSFEGEATLERLMNEDLTPYTTMYQPTSVINWRLSRPSGKRRELEMLVLYEGDDDISKEKFYKIWTKTDWMLISASGRDNSNIVLVDSGINTIGKIPAIPITYKDGFSDDLDDGESLISDISYIAKKIYNLDSNAQEIIEHSAYPILEIPYREGDGKELNIGVGNALPYDINHPEARAAWIEPPHTSLNEILQWRNQGVQDILAISNTLGASMEKQAESGVALEARMQSLHSTLGAMAKKLQKAEINIVDLLMQYVGVESTVAIKYPTSFSVRDLSSDLDIAIKSLSVVQSPTFKEKVQEEIAIKVLTSISGDDNITQEEKTAIGEELAGSTDNATKILNDLNNANQA